MRRGQIQKGSENIVVKGPQQNAFTIEPITLVRSASEYANKDKLVRRASKKADLNYAQMPLRKYSFNQLQNLSTAELQATLKYLDTELACRKAELLNIYKHTNIYLFRNQSLKHDVLETYKLMYTVRTSHTLRMMEIYKENRDMVLFHNEIGMSPFELMLIGSTRNPREDNDQICMVCFGEIETNSPVIMLPCDHMLHRECGTQSLLYSKQCPSCGVEINIYGLKHRMIKEVTDYGRMKKSLRGSIEGISFAGRAKLKTKISGNNA